MLLIPTNGNPFIWYGWIETPVLCPIAVEPPSPLLSIVNWPELPTTYETTSFSIKASPLSVAIPAKLINAAVDATDTSVSSIFNSAVVWVAKESGSIPSSLTALFPPWCAWLYWITSITLPVLRSLRTSESALTVAPVAAVLVSLLAP